MICSVPFSKHHLEKTSGRRKDAQFLFKFGQWVNQIWARDFEPALRSSCVDMCGGEPQGTHAVGEAGAVGGGVGVVAHVGARVWAGGSWAGRERWGDPRGGAG